jgi:Caspase domain
LEILMNIHARISWLAFAVVLVLTIGMRPGHAETRFALVIGNSDYKTGALATPANDAGLVADALSAAGFTVTGAANLDQPTLRQTLTEFVEQVEAAGPDAVALVYLSGYGLQFNGDNYFVPVDADIQNPVDVPLQAIRISDFLQPLAALPARVKIVILDGARENPFARAGGQPLASGLALFDPIPGVALAFNAAPGTVAPNETGPYGAYATALTEMIAAGGLSLDDIFARVRLRVSDLTQGAEIPWYVSGLQEPFLMTELAAGAPPPPSVTPIADIRDKPLRDFGNVDDAYAAVLELDTIDGYVQFLALYPNSPYSQRIAAMLAVRREELIWRRCIADDTPPAYWSYLRRYPDGPHAWDARRRLAILRAAFEPPPDFVIVDFGVPPPPPAELVFIDRPVLIFAGPGWAPPPRPPVIFLPPRPPEFTRLPPPPRPSGRFALPVPPARVIPAFVRPPPRVVAPPAAPGGGRVPVSLPKAVQPGAHPPAGTPGKPPIGGAPIVSPPHPGPPPPPPAAAIKPSPPPPGPPGARPAVVKPAPPPPHPPAPTPAVKPAPPPPHAPPPPKPAVVKPAPPPPHAPPPPKPAVVKPAPPPPKPPPPKPVAKPAPPPPKPAPKPPQCPPGKHPTPQGCK